MPMERIVSAFTGFTSLCMLVGGIYVFFHTTQEKTDANTTAFQQLTQQVKELSDKLDRSNNDLSLKIANIPTDHQALVNLQSDMTALRQDINILRDRMGQDENKMAAQGAQLDGLTAASRANIYPGRR